MEEIVEETGKGIFSLIKWVLINVFIELFIHSIGYITLKVVTIGRYPKSFRENEKMCVLFGFLAIAIAIGIIMIVNSMQV